MTETCTSNVEAFKNDSEIVIESPESIPQDESIIEIETVTNGTTKVSTRQENDEIMEINETEEVLDLDPEDAFVKVSAFTIKEFRSIKTQIEDAILKKIKKMESVAKKSRCKEEKYVYYFKNFAIDKIGNTVGLGETGIAEGWSIPMYENEFRNLLGLPFTEDSASIRIKKPRQECFNCLSINHGVRECPVRIDQERIEFHKRIFTTQSQQAQDQAQLFSNRYTSELDSKANRGFVPGKISDKLKEALGCKPNQLPPYVYIMRQYGYPIAWLMEARVAKSKLSVLDGGLKSEDGIADVISDETEIEYDSDKIYSFKGFNEAPEPGILDESQVYGVKRYGPEFSKEKFLSTLKLENKNKVVGRKMNKSEESSEEVITEKKTPEAQTDPLSKETSGSIESLNEIGSDDNSENGSSAETDVIDEDSNDDSQSNEFSSPKKRKVSTKPSSSKAKKSMLGTSFTEIPGTPIVNNTIGGVDRVPNWEKFSENICPHKEFEMDPNTTPTGSYQKIVKLTKSFKTGSSNEISKDF